MSDFGTVTLTRPPPDTSKRVRYSYGLVLGVDELEQEQAYLMERDRRHQRALHGYGTLCGLRLSIRDNPGRGPEVHLSRGMAVDRAGETICVPSDQCAALNGWLQKNQGHLALAASPPTRLVLDVRLCALECETDPVPIPGGPCRTQQDAIQPSRVKDNFKLELVPRDGFVTSPPASPPLTSPPTTGRSESEATRALSDLLSHVELGDVGPYASLGDLLAWVRSIGGIAATSPPSAVPPVIVLPRATGFDMLRAALVVWVTEVRPRVMLDGCCARTPRGAEACVSLGYVELDVQADFTVAMANVDIDESERPILLDTSVLQQWMLAQTAPPPASPLMAYGPQALVAAGSFDAAGGSIASAFNPTLALAPLLRNTDFHVTFDEYIDPATGGGGYIVRGTVDTGGALDLAAGIVQLIGYRANGIDIRVSDYRGQHLNRNFHLEITAYGRMVP